MRRIHLNELISPVSVRTFDSSQRFGKELGFGHKMQDIPVLTGNPRPVAREDSWQCAYKLSDRMEGVVRDVLQKHQWSETEIQRELDQIFERKALGSRASLNAWSTVEEFQRTPWYRRYRPSDDTVAKFISYEAIKLLENALIPPSLREDPYSHLRKRHMEDNWMNDRFCEDSAKYVTREKLAQQTIGTPQYGRITRKKFMDFEKKFITLQGSNKHVNEAYAAWLRSVDSKNDKK
ncbi:unnamed protein product [Phytomonas sp. Hart1]|nr:unnamed protein product [Phytomonas sp. Hart1]|eukprot:CCW67921.1 unnamed protein product [Phytomonas sp. isolate Hart1]